MCVCACVATVAAACEAGRQAVGVCQGHNARDLSRTSRDSLSLPFFHERGQQRELVFFTIYR